MADGSKVLLITGASSGIGAAAARAAAAEGWRLVLAERSEAKLRALAQELGAGRALAVPTDVADWEDQQRMAAAAVERFGRIDAVFANAGVGGSPGGFSGAPPESWRRLVEVNVLGVAHTLRATLAHVRAARGHVVITGSVAGRRVLSGSMYSATKWAVSAIGYGLREELRGSGVRVTLLEPGVVDTPFFDAPRADALAPEDVARSLIYALSQPPGVDVHELVILPTPPADEAR
jgi:NADP-dependent 3-hydroxy acid dehydrogenase YdfG